MYSIEVMYSLFLFVRMKSRENKDDGNYVDRVGGDIFRKRVGWLFFD